MSKIFWSLRQSKITNVVVLVGLRGRIYSPNDIDNDFRHISVLPQLAKVLEKL